MAEYFMNTALAAMLVIFAFGVYGVMTNDPSPHPVGMVWAGLLYFGIYVVYRVVVFAYSIVTKLF